MIAKFDGKCKRCGTEFRAGDSIRYSNLTKQTFCRECWGAKMTPSPLADRIAAIQAARTEPAPSGPESAPEAPAAISEPLSSASSSDAYLAPLAAALARHMKLPETEMSNVTAGSTYTRRLLYKKGRLAENPLGLHVVMPDETLREVYDFYYRESPPAYMLKIRSFNREIIEEFNAGAAVVLRRDVEGK